MNTLTFTIIFLKDDDLNIGKIYYLINYSTEIFILF